MRLTLSASPLDDFIAGLAQIVINENVLYSQYKDRPNAFAKDILGVEWTTEIAKIAEALLQYPKVVVPAGHAVGKTHGVAGIVLWWLSTRKTKVVTTAPTWRQVKDLIWRELRAQHRRALKTVPSRPLMVSWDIEEDWFATGISTNDPMRFQGYHSEELLVVLDEAAGVEKFIWTAIEDGLAVSEGNRILAIGNPVDPSGRFAQVCRSSEWKTFTMSCLDHPNVKQGKRLIPGAVTRRWVEERIKRWCIPYEDITGEEETTDAFEYKEKQYIPNDMFRVRVLGQFPIEGGSQLFPLHRIWAAFHRDPKPIEGKPTMGLDVARFGDDNSVLTTGMTNGVVLSMDPWQGARTTISAGRVKYWVADIGRKYGRVENIAIDVIGLGAGVVDILVEGGYPVLEVNVGMDPYDKEKYFNLRAELTFNLADQFRIGSIDLTRVIGYEEVITEELTSITFDYTPKGQRKVSKKDAIKEKIGRSPDFADSLALYCGYLEAGYLKGLVVEKQSEWGLEPMTWSELG